MRSAFWGISLLVLVGNSPSALAQPMVPGGMQRPSVSPYINLLRGNSGINNAALNYFGIVRPEQQFRQQAGFLQQQLNQTNQTLGIVAGGQGDVESITGRGASFMNYSHYFNSFGTPGGAPGMGMGGMGMARPAGIGGNLGGMAMPGAAASGTSGRGIAPGMTGPRIAGPRR